MLCGTWCHARAVRGVTRPQLVLPSTAHTAFHEAAHRLGLETLVVPVDPVTCLRTCI
jgi:glutamate/tyrosine decarboxylase-like PLP-dependent enzyme